jgi:hypothetical protein
MTDPWDWVLKVVLILAIVYFGLNTVFAMFRFIM